MRGFKYVGYIRKIDYGETVEYFNLYQRGKKVHMFATDDNHESIKAVKVFETAKEVEEFISSNNTLRAFLKWTR